MEMIREVLHFTSRQQRCVFGNHFPTAVNVDEVAQPLTGSELITAA